MKKLTPLKTLKRKAWQAISQYIRKRDPWCVTCLMEGKQKPSEDCGHFIPNSERKQDLGGNELWYDERNLNGQCVKCNNYKSGNLAPYALYLEKKYGAGILQELHKLYQKPKKWTRNEIEEIIRKYSKT